jgi:hypothetical protein
VHPIEAVPTEGSPENIIPVQQDRKRQKIVHNPSTGDNDHLLGTVQHWLDEKWLSPESLLRLVENYQEDNTEGISLPTTA